MFHEIDRDKSGFIQRNFVITLSLTPILSFTIALTISLTLTLTLKGRGHHRCTVHHPGSSLSYRGTNPNPNPNPNANPKSNPYRKLSLTACSIVTELL